MSRSGRIAIGLNGTLLRGSIRLPFHPHAPVQELEIVELSMRNAVEVDTMTSLSASKERQAQRLRRRRSAGGHEGDDESEVDSIDDAQDGHVVGDDGITATDVLKIGANIIAKVDALAELMHPNIQALVRTSAWVFNMISFYFNKTPQPASYWHLTTSSVPFDSAWDSCRCALLQSRSAEWTFLVKFVSITVVTADRPT